jgi:hypothetical protein
MPRRWTVMLIPHGSDAPMSIAVSERALRFLTSIIIAVALVAVIGLGTIIAQLGRFGTRGANEATSSTPTPSRDLASLRERVAHLNGALDTIRDSDARLRQAAGVPAADTAKMMQRFLSRVPIFRRWAQRGNVVVPVNVAGTDSMTTNGDAQHASAVADSLVAHASDVANRYGTLADSATKAKRDSGQKSR